MLKATRRLAGARWAIEGSGLLLLLGALASQAARADDMPVRGTFITVPNPITSEAVNRVKDATERYVAPFRAPGADGARRDLKLVIVYDFNPGGKPAGSSEFGPCRDLARYLVKQHDFRTVAFVHAETTRHTVLPVLACRDIVLSSEAKLGDVRRGEEAEPLESDVLEAYRNVVKGRRCPAVALKMLQPDMEVVKALKGGADWYIARGQEKEEQENNGVIVTDPTAHPVIGRGAGTTLFGTNQALDLGLAAKRKENRQGVAEAYDLGPASLREDPLMGRTPVAWRIEVRGAVTDSLAETVRRQIGRAISQKANLIILELDCGGGDGQVARDLAVWLRDRKDDKGEYPVMTIAYVPKAAPDTAVFLALGCTEIVMRDDKEARFGDFSAVLKEKRNGQVVYVDPNKYRAMRDSLVELAKQQGYPALLAQGMLDRELEVYRASHVKSGESAFLSGEEMKADREAREPQWEKAELVKRGGPQGEALVLTADEAHKWGIVRHKVEGHGDLYARYGLSESQVQVASYDWLDEFAEFLRRPVTRIFLVMIGLVCLMLELKMPGVGVPGVIAAVCFILFFWSHSQSAGLEWLGVLLFVLGLVLIGLEIFVLPGFGVAGISGVLLVVFSLALVALEKRPQTSEEWVSLLNMMAQFGLTLIGAVLLVVLLVSYLPHIPYLNRLMLRPRTDPEVAGAEVAEAVRPETAALLGAIGVAATPLRPAGKVKFGDEYIDVVAEGAYVESGGGVQVVEIEGNRIVVKEVL